MIIPDCQKTEQQFDAFIKRVLSNELKDFLRAYSQRMQKETLFCELENSVVEQFPAEEQTNGVDFLECQLTALRFSTHIRDELLYQALMELGDKGREIILMTFWLEMTEHEIADCIGCSQGYINKLKHSSYEKLKKILEGYGYDNF